MSEKQQGSNRGSQGSSLSALLSTLLPIFVISSVILLVFLVARGRYERVYQPRTYLKTLDKGQRTPKQTPGFLGWLKEFKALPDDYVVRHSSLDNYLWLRFFKMLTAMCFVGCIVTWPILFPVSATGGNGESGLDILSFSNVAGVYRYFAYAIVSWIFLGFVMYLITRETMFYINLRQAYFLSPYNVSRISSRTVLFVDVPETYRDEKHIRHILPDVRHVWLTYNVKELEDMIEDRTDAATKLESAELKMIGQYVQKQHKQGNSGEELVEGRSGSFVVDKKNRPTHKLKPLIGQKVDTIDWSRGQLHDLNPRIAHKQREHFDKEGAIFVEFESVRAAQSAFQMVAHQQVFHMTAKEVGMAPDTVIWKNLGRSWWEVKIKAALGIAFISFLCLFWTIPVGFIGILTHVDSLTNLVPFLSFINDIPSQILGVVTGLLPVILLAVLMKLVPIFAAMIARTFEPTESAVQMRVQSWYFPFEVIQVFLITTFTSAASAVTTKIIQDPTGAPALLARNLPKASNFYISYFILKGLLTAALQVLNIAPLLFILVLGKLLDKTPRKKYNRYVGLGGLNWGVLYPMFTNMGVIALSYSCIAPLVLGFATIGFGILYLAFRYNVLFTLGTQTDMKGAPYARALQQLTVGVYLSEFCLIGLFAIGTSKGAGATGPLILEIILLVATVLYHLQMRKSLQPLTTSLPSDLLAEETRDPNESELEKGGKPNYQNVAHAPHTNGAANRTTSDSDNSSQTAYQVPDSASLPPEQPGIKGKIMRFLKPNVYASAAVLSHRVLSPHLAEPVRPYTKQERDIAYMNPALVDECPEIWLARDEYGFSRKEVNGIRHDVGDCGDVTDEGAWFDEKGKVVLDEERVTELPLFEDGRWSGGRDVY